MKKIALLLVLSILFGSVLPLTASAASETIEPEFEVLKEKPVRTPGKDCYETLGNPGFEILDSETKFYEWGFTSHLGQKNTFLGGDLVERSTDAHSGEYAANVHVSAGQYCDLLKGLHVQPGQVYEFSIWHKKVKEGNSGTVTVIFTGSGIAGSYSFGRAKMNFSETSVSDGWVEKTLRFTVPENAAMFSISLGFTGPGEILWDDASLLHITDKMPVPDTDQPKEPIEFIEIKNPGFELDTAGAAPNSANGWTPKYEVEVSEAYAHSGKNSLKMVIPQGKTDAMAMQNLSGFKKGATYQLSCYVRIPGDKKVDVCPWFYWSGSESYQDDAVSAQLGQTKRHHEYRKNADWERLVFEFTPPDGAKSCDFNLRMRSYPGEVYIDDISIYMVKRPYAVLTETDETFYYSEFPTGECTGTPYVLEDPANSSAEFSLVTPAGEETHKEVISNLSGGVKYIFRTDWMEEKGKRYHVRVKVYDALGGLIDTHDHPVYRFDRPTYLGADGVFRKDGKEYANILGTGVDMDVLSYHPEKTGVKIVQLVKDDYTLIERMDAAYAQGMVCLVGLYYASSCAGSPDRIENTKTVVSQVKDHPALFGYMVQDEPYQKGQPVEEMITAYETIRNMDPHHPIFLDDSVPGSYEWLFRYCDVLHIDYYAGARADAGVFMSDLMDSVMEASKGRKPFALMEQAFDENGYMPTVDIMRHLAYQSLFSGASGYSFHSFGSDDGIQQKYVTRPEYQEIIDGWGKWESQFMMDAFVFGTYKFVNYAKTDNVLWATFTDSKDIYAVILNRQKNVPTEAVIPLSDGAGTIKVDAFTARTMTGESKRITGNGTLTLSLAPMEAVVWKITPSSTLNASHLKASKYRDIISYPWAYNAIATLEEKGIINEEAPNWYGPKTNITRGDYAMFLVRTLGLTDGAGENFVDVAPTAEYAKELAIGRAAGILQGVGDNKFNPEAQITRQDMMTMTSRAMKLAGAADLAAFSDSGMIADYASSHVAAMVAEGLIKGNADGTINPLGNTTRAEAAVIMQRILAK